ncbi:hypothetical protein Bca52824_075692 [Brassica carinata]|uniref:DUF223 domain-containing protein n=1 Tax=Brassica carinata TaxID=52824 RepID=A0A8X7PTK6_BRACI|nr:hypothetical protein Bca52824_075692 [Brassica carinata]
MFRETDESQALAISESEDNKLVLQIKRDKWMQYPQKNIHELFESTQGVKIHASCKQTLMPKLENYFRVGEWKVITNFTLSPASGLNRPTNHRYKMKFVSQTSISDSNLQCHNMFLDLHDFANVLNGSQDPSFLIDVVGEVLDLGGLDIVQFARKEVTRLEFTLRDIKDQRLHCCITGGLADKLTQEGNMPNNGDICLIRFAKLCNYKGKLQVSNAFDSSLLLLNPDISEAQALNQMFHGDDNSLDVYQPKKTRQKWSQYPFRTIQEMKHTDKVGSCRVICTVYAIDTASGWYYFACVVCNNKVFKAPIVFDDLDESNWWCEWCQCSVRKAAPSSYLALLVQDLTGESNFNLLDSAATFIVKISAAKVVNQWFDEFLTILNLFTTPQNHQEVLFVNPYPVIMPICHFAKHKLSKMFVYCYVLSVKLNERTRPSTKQNLPDLNTSGKIILN